MPKFTTTLEVELEVTFEYDYQPAEPDVGISNDGYDISIDSIKGMTAKLQMMTPHPVSGFAWDKYSSTERPVKMQPWLDFDDAFEAALIARVEDQIRDEHQGSQEERSYYDD